MEIITNFTNTIKEKFSTKVVPDNRKREKVIVTVEFTVYKLDEDDDDEDDDGNYKDIEYLHPNMTLITPDHLMDWAKELIFSLIDFNYGENPTIKNIEDNTYEITFDVIKFDEFDHLYFMEDPDDDGNYPIVQKANGQIITNIPYGYNLEEGDIEYHVSVDMVDYEVLKKENKSNKSI
jgi:hypothetical protein